MWSVSFALAIPAWVLVFFYAGGMLVLTLSMIPSQGFTVPIPSALSIGAGVFWCLAQGLLIYRGTFSLVTASFLDAAAYPTLTLIVGTAAGTESWDMAKALKLIAAMALILWAQNPDFGKA